MFSSEDEDQELICYNGRVHSLVPGLEGATVLASRGQELVYVGPDRAAAESLLSARARRIDLAGATVLPGLIDGHAHIISEGLRLGELDVHHLGKEELLGLVGREAAGLPPGQWVKGYGWNQELWPGRAWPDKKELDSVAPANPVVLDRMDKHSAWANSLALKLSGLDESSPDPPGGQIGRNPDGSLSGLLVGAAMFPVWNALPNQDPERRYQALLRAQEEMLSFGLTSVMEAGALVSDLALMRRGYESGRFGLRVRAMLLAGREQDRIYLESGGRRQRGLYGQRLSVDGVKIHSDGSLGSRSAWLLDDYADRPGLRGQHTYSDEELAVIVERANEHDLGLSVHAIGDGAVHQILDIMEAALKRRPRPDHRWRIEHFQVLAEGDLERALKLGVVASLQTVGLMSDMDMAEDRLGSERLKRSYLWRGIIDRGGVIVNGSDGPVESVNPFLGLYAAVSRRNLEGRPAGGWLPEQKAGREEALKSYTAWSAWSEFNEARKGTLAAGRLADYVVVDRDPLSCPEDEIKDTRVMMTILGGRVAFER